jgi:hypothetical protein
MSQKIRATYSQGSLIPQHALNLQDNTELELIVVHKSHANVLDPDERKQILQSLLNRMRQSSVNSHSHRLTSE